MTKKNRSESQKSCQETPQELSYELAKKPNNYRSIASHDKKLSETPSKRSKRNIRSHFETVTVNDNGRPIGEDHRNARYLDDDVERARELVASGHYTLREISQMLDMPIRTIRDYANGKRRNQSVAGWKKIRRYRKE